MIKYTYVHAKKKRFATHFASSQITDRQRHEETTQLLELQRRPLILVNDLLNSNIFLMFG